MPANLQVLSAAMVLGTMNTGTDRRRLGVKQDTTTLRPR